MDYRKMITDYAKNGGDEKKMWAAVAATSEAMEFLAEVAPEKHDCYMRKVHETLYGKHYNEEMALADVAKLHYTDADGNKHSGAHWTVDEVESASSSMSLPKNTTKWDVFVAANASYADFCKEFTEDQILAITYNFWFADEDWKSDGKIWDYMSLNH